jgi:hypothetical protein
MARSRRSLESRFARTPAAAPSRFSWDLPHETAYEYWAPTLSPTRQRRRSRRPKRLASDVLPPLVTQPRYYAFAWQLLIWLAVATLALMMIGG